MKFLKVLAIVLTICLLGSAFIACDQEEGDGGDTTPETTAQISVTLVIKKGSTTVVEGEKVTCDGTLGNAIELYSAGEGYEGECFSNGILKSITEELTATGDQRWIAYYEDEGQSQAFDSILNQTLTDGKTVVLVLE